MSRLGRMFAGAVALCAIAILPYSLSADATSVRWEGVTDESMLTQARKDIADAKAANAKTLVVHIISPGGPVVTSLEIARLVREAYEKDGLVIEIHAEAMCASGCTMVLAAGTPGYRYIANQIFFLVHSMQQNDSCISWVVNPQTVDEKVTDLLLTLMRDSYVHNTGRSNEEVQSWITCGKERVGPGALAVEMGIADQTE